MNDWPVKLPSRIKPAIEQIAREEFLPVPELVRQLVQKALLQHQLQQGLRQK